MKSRFYTLIALILAVLLCFTAVHADNSAESSAFTCLQKVQNKIVLNNFIQITDLKNYTYSGYFKGIDYKQNKFLFMRDEPGIEASMKSMLIDDISQIVVQKKKVNMGNIRRLTFGGVFVGLAVVAVQVVVNDKSAGYRKNDKDLSDFIVPAVIGAGVGAFIGLISGGKVTVSQTITCGE